VLSVVALNSTIYSFLRCLPVGDRIELRGLARSSGPAPVDHVAVMPAISVQSQRVVREKSPALGIRRHISN